MDLREDIRKNRSKEHMQRMAAWVGTDADRFAAFMHIFLNDEPKMTERAAWLFSTITDKNRQLALPYLRAVYNRMMQPEMHVAVKRAVLGCLQHVPIPEELEADLMNTTFDWLADPKETVAVRCHSMTILHNLSKRYPELRQELIAIIEDELEHQPTPGFVSRAKQVLGKKK